MPLSQSAGQGRPHQGHILNEWEANDMKAAVDEFNWELQVRLLFSSSDFLDL